MSKDASIDPSSAVVEPASSAKHHTTAVNRQWSDVDAGRLLGTFGLSSFCYSLCGNPLFLAVARQQCARESVGVISVLAGIRKQEGIRGWFRGAGVSVFGTVLSEAVYYFIIEFGKEKLPFESQGVRNFNAGLLADTISGPIWTPFAVVSQLQMVAGAGMSKNENFKNGIGTTREVISREGWRALFKGTLLSLTMVPLSGTWWVIYERLKKMAYVKLQQFNQTETARSAYVASIVYKVSPECCRSLEDNPAVHAVVGGLSSAIVSTFMNPLWVIRTRLQVLPRQKGVRVQVLWLVQDLLKNEGPRGLLKGIWTNVIMGSTGGICFGAMYEGTKKFADNTES